jgi:L-ascorbate 6-phosphate lactonase
VVLLTHSHCDHADPETLSVLAGKAPNLVAPRDAAKVALDAGFPPERVRIIHAGESFNLSGGGTSGTASFALPTDGSDLNHVGYLLVFPNGSSFWNTGDTAWHETLPMLATAVFKGSLPAGKTGPDLMAVCINTGYGNLSHWDAARLAGAAKPLFAIPVHWDLFPHNSCDPFPFKTSLEKNAPGSVYSPLEHGKRYDFSGGKISLVV